METCFVVEARFLLSWDINAGWQAHLAQAFARSSHPFSPGEKLIPNPPFPPLTAGTMEIWEPVGTHVASPPVYRIFSLPT